MQVIDELETALGAPRSMFWPVDQLEPKPKGPKRPTSSRNKPTWALLNHVSQKR